MSANNETIPVVADSEKDQQTGQDVAAIDAEAEESSQTGKVPQSEVNDLKDSLGGGEVLDDSTGVQTRGVKNDAYKQEREVDSADIGEESNDGTSKVAQ